MKIGNILTYLSGMFLGLFLAQLHAMDIKHSDFPPHDQLSIIRAAQEGDVSYFKECITSTTSLKIYADGLQNIAHLLASSLTEKKCVCMEVLKKINILAVWHLSSQKDAEGKTPLHYVAQQNCPQAIKAATFFLNHSASINDRDNKGNTALTYAIQAGNNELVKMLLYRKASFEISDFQGLTPLHYAAKVGDEYIARYLLSLGANSTSKDIWGKKPEDYASEAHHENLRILLSQSAQFIAVDSHGLTLVHQAAKDNNISVMRAYCATADLSPLALDLQDDYGLTALHYAANAGFGEIVEMLLQLRCVGVANGKTIQANLSRSDKQGRTVFHVAVKKGRSSIVHKLLLFEVDPFAALQRQDLDGRTPLHYAALSNDIELIKLLLSYGADPSICDNYGTMSEHLATDHNVITMLSEIRIALFKDILGRNKLHTTHLPTEIVDIFKRGYSPLLLMAQDARGVTPLMGAIERNSKDCVFALLQTQDKVATDEYRPYRFRALTIKDNNNLSVLHAAVKSGNGEILYKLLSLPECESIINDKDIHGRTPLHYAGVTTLPIIRLLLAYGASPRCADNNDKLPYEHAFAANKYVCGNILHDLYMLHDVDKDGRNRFHHAVINNDAQGLEKLSQRAYVKSYINARDSFNKMPLHYALENNNHEIISLLLSLKLLQKDKAVDHLPPYATDILQAEYDGASLVHFASRHSNAEVLAYLLRTCEELRKQCNVQDKSGKTPLHYAAQRGDLLMIQVLCMHGALPFLRDNENLVPADYALKESHEQCSEILYALSRLGALDDHGRNEFHRILITGKDDLSFFIDYGFASFLINQPDENGKTPLHLLIEQKYYPLLILFLAADMPRTVIYSSPRSFNNVLSLINHSLGDLRICDNDGNNGIHLAVLTNINSLVRMILVSNRYSHLVNNSNNAGLSPLHQASAFGNLETVKALLAAGADPHKTAVNGEPIEYALANMKTEVVEFLKKIKSWSALDAQGRNALHRAVMDQSFTQAHEILSISAASILINARDAQGDTPLSLAVGLNNKQLVRMLLYQGGRRFNKVRCDLNLRYEKGKTILHYAALHASTSIINLLIEAARDCNLLDARDDTGSTVIHDALSRAHVNTGVITALMRAGANIHAQNLQDELPKLNSKAVKDRYVDFVRLLYKSFEQVSLYAFVLGNKISADNVDPERFKEIPELLLRVAMRNQLKTNLEETISTRLPVVIQMENMEESAQKYLEANSDTLRSHTIESLLKN